MRARFSKTLLITFLVIIAFSFLFLKVPLYSKARSYLVMYAHSSFVKTTK